MKAFIAALSVACLATVSEALFAENLILGSATAGPAHLALAGGSAGVVSTAAVVAGGAILLKAGALAALYLASRQKRSTDSEELFTFNYMTATEPSACYRRLICDLASGEMPESENDVIVSLFKEEVDKTSPKYDFSVAAEVGKALKSVQACELRYSCPLTGEQINKLF